MLIRSTGNGRDSYAALRRTAVTAGTGTETWTASSVLRADTLLPGTTTLDFAFGNTGEPVPEVAALQFEVEDAFLAVAILISLQCLFYAQKIRQLMST